MREVYIDEIRSSSGKLMGWFVRYLTRRKYQKYLAAQFNNLDGQTIKTVEKWIKKNNFALVPNPKEKK